MDTGEALLRAVLADKADDLPRLVYADYLEENGDADLAEFIRVQCEIERHRPEAVDYVRNGRYRREDAVRLDWRLVDLHDREMKLLWAKHRDCDSANWEAWCHAEARDADGEPCCANGRGGMTVTPHGSIGLGEGSNSCVVPFSHSESGPPYDSHGRRVVQYFRRGFVTEIRCTLDCWRGIECECRDQAGFTRACESCGCLRAAPGIGPQIVKRHPVERVVITDKVAWEWRDNPRTHGWFDGTGVYGPPVNVSHIIPPDVARFLVPAMTKTADQYTAESPEAADKALSDALIKWAESQIT